MSIAFDKRDYAYYDSEEDSFSDEDSIEEQDKEIKIPLEKIDKLVLFFTKVAEEQSLDLFENLTSESLDSFINTYK